MMNKRLLVVFSIIIVCSFLPIQPAAAATELPTGLQKLSCPQKISRIKYRAVLLGEYKKTEQKRYSVFHKRWQARIVSAGQWVPKDAEKTRDSLYTADKLHASISKEIESQIAESQKLTDIKLDCTPAHHAEIIQQLNSIQGLRDGKVVGGNARINQLQKIESKYQDEDFHKQAFAMLDRLHAEKAKHPKPSHAKLKVI
jgi:hypothetical protein